MQMIGRFVVALCAFFYAVGADQHENCMFWAENGECDANPNYMMQSCSEACAKVAAEALTDIPENFYSIVETDIDGNAVSFENFRGKVVFIINVASQVNAIRMQHYGACFVINIFCCSADTLKKTTIC
jgi:hypothetical protein